MAAAFPYLVNQFFRLLRLRRPAGGFWQALKMMRRMKRSPNEKQSIFVGGARVVFRRIDEAALNEVLFEAQYDFLAGPLKSRPRPKVLDVGANIGCFSVWVGLQNANAEVLAVEANAATADLARQNLEDLARRGGEWRLVNGAAGACDGGTVYLHTEGQSVGHRVAAEGETPVETFSLKTLLDMLSPNGGSVDLVKIDIEGSEEAFLADVEEQFRRINAIVVELHHGYCNTAAVENSLTESFPRIQRLATASSNRTVLYCSR